MKIFLTLSLFFLTKAPFAQFAIIYDKEGFCNVRSRPEKGNNIIDTLETGHFVYCFDTNGNWTNVDYAKGRKELNGQVYTDRLKLISDYQEIPFLAKNEHKVVISKDSIKV